MIKDRKYMRWSRLSALLLALLLTLGSFAALYTGLLPAPVTVEAATAETYYDGLNTGLQGAAFRTELANLITSTHTHQTTYSELASVYKTADADPNKSGNIIWFYTGTSTSFSGFGSGGGTTNREHVWPKDGGDAFPEKSEAGSDAHHLRPTEANLNSARGSKSFGEVSQTSSNVVKQNGSTSYGATADELCYSNSTYFYPAKGYRGATARILFYVQVRWGDAYGLSFVLGAGNCKTIGDIETLMKWHLEEPPTEEEIRRNEVIFGIQGNRNPFIDHPEYAAKIFCYDGKAYNDKLQAVVAQYGDYTPPTEEKVTAVTLPVSTLTLAPGASYTLNPTITPAGVTCTLSWYTDDSSILKVDQSGKVTAVGNGTANVYVYCIENPEAYATVTVNVRSVTSISITGAPAYRYYSEGELFNPMGLTVRQHFSDGTSETVSGTACQWLDGTTGEARLSEGTTSVICRYAGKEATVSGITVEASKGGSLTINRGTFSGSGSYQWATWTVGDISGQGFIYTGVNTKIQMNNNKTAYYIFNTTPLSGGVITVTVKLYAGANEKQMELLTSTTPYATGSGAPTSGTSHGKKTVTEAGVTWTLTTSDPYFSLNYADSGALYLESIEITYGGACSHASKTYHAPVSAGCESYGNLAYYECNECHKALDASGQLLTDYLLAPTGHSYTEVVKYPSFDKAGSITETCSVCGDTRSETLPILDSTRYTVAENGTLYSYSYNGTVYAIRPVRFYAANVTVSDSYSLSFRIPASSFTGVGVTAYTVRLESADGALSYTYTDGYSFERDGGYYYTMYGINPDRIGDSITATVTYTVNGATYTSEKTYSIGEFCYARLDVVTDPEEARMLVDLLNYGAAAQVYTGHNASSLVNAALTNEQKALGTQTPAPYTDVTDLAHATVQNPTVTWKSAGMFLSQTVRMSFRIEAASVAGLSVKITVGADTYTVTKLYADTDGSYVFYFEDLGFSRMDETIYLTVMQGDTAVSNTLSYSAASYAAIKQASNTTTPSLSALIDAMMSFGRSLAVWSK